MREIIFRGKRVDNGKWVEGSFVKDYIHHETRASILVGGCIWFQVISETVGQYTGLTDKNGVKIFEGDIITSGDPNIKYEVEWHDCGLKGRQIGNSSFIGIQYWISKIQVIGNIHDNTNL